MSAVGELFKLAINPIYGVTRLIKYGKNPDDPDNADFGQIVNTIKGAWNDWTGNTANQENIAYQQDYNQQVFNRADTQYQRTVADLRQAGLSAQLASGSPSTVAGAGQAPQRTVGNESQSFERLISLINSIKQTNSNIALASAQAEEAKSAASLNDIKTRYQQKELDTYDETHAADMDVKRANAAYSTAITFIAQQEGQTYASRVQAELDNKAADTDYKKKLKEYYDSSIALNSAKISSSSVNDEYIRQQTENVKKQHEILVQELVNAAKQGEHIDAQTTLLLEQAAECKLDSLIKAYNYTMSQTEGIRTTDQITRLFGINFGSADEAAKKFKDFFYGDHTPTPDDVDAILNQIGSWKK